MTSTAPARAEARALRRQMRSWRRERASTTLYEQLSEAYIWVFSAVLIGAMAISALIQTRVSVAAGCTTAACDDARTSLLWATTIASLGVGSAVCGALGPVMITPATGTWLLSTPIDRRPLLRTRLMVTSAVAALSCGLVVAGLGAARRAAADAARRLVGSRSPGSSRRHGALPPAGSGIRRARPVSLHSPSVLPRGRGCC
ncbi:DUF6297 family protein [Aeromicrobium sp. UC242_57]|uniref:DUF6297 family protein n=1 Tax=Aeromicrobium sp. UC242_57 TaxID=3374624 RepID=UPI0037A9193F